jgi:hypothetical protein
MFWSIWPLSDVKIFLMRKLLSFVVNIYAGPFDGLVCWSWCIVFFLAVCFAECLVQEQQYILTTQDISFLIKKILRLDDGHIG